MVMTKRFMVAPKQLSSMARNSMPRLSRTWGDKSSTQGISPPMNSSANKSQVP